MSSGTGVQILIVAEDDHDTRIDKWFFRHFPGLGKGMLYKLIRKGQVRLDGGRVKPDTRVMAGNEIRIPPMPEEAYQPPKATVKKITPEERAESRAFLKSVTLFEDQDVLVINKPYNLATQGGSKISKHIDGILNAVNEEYKLVHRLDKETSGVLLIAKNTKTARDLGRIFKGREIHKYYWAILSPAPQMNDGVIEARIAKGPARGGEYMMINDEDGKYSRTEYQVVERAYTKAAWVLFKPETGRTHQLRLHAQLINAPIIGDDKYKIEMQDPIDLEDLKHADKLHLHARRLVLPHPSGKGNIEIEAPLPLHMVETFEYFGFDENVAAEMELAHDNL